MKLKFSSQTLINLYIKFKLFLFLENKKFLIENLIHKLFLKHLRILVKVRKIK